MDKIKPLLSKNVELFDVNIARMVAIWQSAAPKRNGWTVAMLLDFIHEYGLAQDEYFGLHGPLLGTDIETIYDSPLFKLNTSRIIVYWQSSGHIHDHAYYVYVTRIDTDQEQETLLIGKFWSWRRAMFATNMIQYLINLL